MEKINVWFDDLNKLIQDSFIAYKHLSAVREKRKELAFLNEDFFIFFQYQQWFMLNIQLAKIFDCKKTQQRNVIDLFNKIISGKFNDELIPFLSDSSKNKSGLDYNQFIDKIKVLKDSIKSCQVAIDKVTKVRNKIYAHTDFDRIQNFPTIEEIKSLIDLADKLYNNSRGLLYGIHTDFTRGINNLTINFVIKTIEQRAKR